MLRFEVDGLESSAMRELIARHLRLMRSQSPPQSVHALDVSGLQAPDVTLWSVWIGDDLVGCGALKRLSATAGEIKSMHVREAWRGRGWGAKILAHLEAEARARGLRRLSLETGSQPEFEPGRQLYRAFGYEVCEAYAPYRPDPNSTFMTKRLD